MVEVIISLLSAVLIAGLGVVVLYRSSHDETRRWFFAFCLSLSLWQVAYFLSNVQFQYAMLFNQLTFVGPLFGEYFFFNFIRSLYRQPGHDHQSKKLVTNRIILVASCATILGVAASIIPGGVVLNIYPSMKNGLFAGYNITHGHLYLLFVLAFLVLAIIITRVLITISHSKNHIIRQQARLIVAGVTLALVIGLFTNIILPLLLGTSDFSYLGSAAVLILVAVLSIAIVRYKLINIRAVVARSLGYASFIAVLACIYGLTVFIVTDVVFQIHIAAKALIIIALAAALIGLTLGEVKSFFTRLTDRLFFQDAYDPQIFLDSFNQALVGNIELENLLKTSARIIETNLKIAFCIFDINDMDHKDGRIAGTIKKGPNLKDAAQIRAASLRLDTDVIVADFLLGDMSKVKALMDDSNVAVLVRLTPKSTNSTQRLEDLGYILLGQKRSGNLYTPQDVRILGIIANELVIAIQNALRFEQIQQFTVTLQDKVDIATRKLRHTNKRLEELDDIKDDFISMASHQLRTPLTSVKGYLSMVLEGDAGTLNALQIQMLKQAFTSSQRMVFLITDLLNVSRLKTGKFIVDPHLTNISEVAEQEVMQLQEVAELKHIKLTYDKPKDFPVLMLDDIKIRQVIMNFIDNAIYYTPENGHIQVELTNKRHVVELRVVDDGIGVPKGEQHHLFTKFYRGTNARKARPDGTGLGLFMAQKVIVAHAGSVIFASEENVGSTFGFVLPKVLPKAIK